MPNSGFSLQILHKKSLAKCWKCLVKFLDRRGTKHLINYNFMVNQFDQNESISLIDIIIYILNTENNNIKETCKI